MEDFRILEYKDHFRIQKKSFENNYFSFFGIRIFVISKEEKWNTILKNKTVLHIRNCIETENYQFKTKFDCMQFIVDYLKYPIIHNL